MRAARLLQILLILQNRGRQTSAKLAAELEVTPRTILRDVDAMTEAGLPIIVHQGNQGGIELGFNYRTRLTGLAQDEAEAIGIILATPSPMADAVGLSHAATQARAKLIESFPDRVRHTAQQAMQQFRTVDQTPPETDPRVPAIAIAIRGQKVITINARLTRAQVLHPVALIASPTGWEIEDAKSGERYALDACGDINISAHEFSV
ncbi:MAG: HTH domain-containing protein [Paracoccaceae bacterium]